MRSNTRPKVNEGALGSKLGTAGARAGMAEHSRAHHNSTKPSPAEAGQPEQSRWGCDQSAAHLQNPPSCYRRCTNVALLLRQALLQTRQEGEEEVFFQLCFSSDDSFGPCLCLCTVGLRLVLLRAFLGEGTACRFGSVWHITSHAVRHVFNAGAPSTARTRGKETTAVLPDPKEELATLDTQKMQFLIPKPNQISHASHSGQRRPE